MRKLVALVAGLAVLGFVNFGIWQREQLVTGGRVVLLRLSPVDPRSLMQGDYMRLNFEVADRAFPWRSRPRRGDGHVVVGLDGQHVGHFRRIDRGGALARDEIKLRYRIRGGDAKFATNAYFFEEGRAAAFEPAQYGEFRVAEDGEMILIGLRDAGLRPLAGGR